MQFPPSLTEQERLAYLKALGVEVWVENTGSEAASQEISEPALNAVKNILPESAYQNEVVSEVRREQVVEKVEPLPSIDIEQLRAMDMSQLFEHVSDCKNCDLHKTRTQTVFGVGHHKADWLIIGEAPGADEDRKGEPFVGRAGQLLTQMLRAIGLAREEVFIANILKCRPPNNRDPKLEEVAACQHYLNRQIELLEPKMILALGRIAAQSLLDSKTAIGKMRGQLYQFGENQIPMVVTYHPAYLLRSPMEKRKVWEDLKFARKHFIQHQ